MIALKQRFRVESDRSVGIFKPVHDVPLLVTAEGGLAAGLVIAMLIVGLAWRSLRAGPVALALYVCLVPYLLLDHFDYSFPQGLVITGVWLAVLDGLAALRSSREPRMATGAYAARGTAQHALQ